MAFVISFLNDAFSEIVKVQEKQKIRLQIEPENA
jgi:hypothetical protein